MTARSSRWPLPIGLVAGLCVIVVIVLVAVATSGHNGFHLRPAAAAPTTTRSPGTTAEALQGAGQSSEGDLRAVETATAAVVEDQGGPCGPLSDLLVRLGSVAAAFPQVRGRVDMLSQTVTAQMAQRKCPAPAPADPDASTTTTPPLPLVCIGEPGGEGKAPTSRATGPDADIAARVLGVSPSDDVAGPANVPKFRVSIRLTNNGSKRVTGAVAVYATVTDAKGNTSVVGGGPKAADLAPGDGDAKPVTVEVIGPCRATKISIRVGAANAPASTTFIAP